MHRSSHYERAIEPHWPAAEGKISAHVHATYPLARGAQALKDIADRKVMGKVILKP